jgi:ATP-binding cassette subfamily C protein LapB
MSEIASNTSQLFASETDRMDAINRIIGDTRRQASPLARCIAPMLIALDWFGAPRRLMSGLPAATEPFGPHAMKVLFRELGFKTRETFLPTGERRADPMRGVPVGSVVEFPDGPRVFLGELEGQPWWHDGADLCPDAPPRAARAIVVERDIDHQPIQGVLPGWLDELYLSARREIGGILSISFVINLLALAVSLFAMFVYNTVIPSAASTSLWGVTVGALIAISGAWGLRLLRVGLTARLSAWAGLKISDITLRKSISFPVEMSTRLGVENNLTRLRSLEGVRQWFGGAGGVVSADYPFVLVFLVTLAILGGWVVVVPIVGLLLFALASWPASRLVQARSREAGRANRQMAELTSLVAQRLRALRGVRGSAFWHRRIAELVSQSVAANRTHAEANGLAQAIGQAISSLTVLGTMGVGIALVLDGDMSTGGLIAAMMLIWRITAPAQRMFGTQVRMRQLMDAGRQLRRLLQTEGEASNPQLTSPVASLLPSLEVDRLFYRYSADREPALNGVSFALEPGEVLAVVGPNGAGKTTLLEAICGTRTPQNGTVRVGDRDIRQFDPADYRSWHGYTPQKTPGVPISLPQSMRLRRPESTDAELNTALTRVAGEKWWVFFDASSAEEAFDVSISPAREDRDALRGRAIVRLAASLLGDPPLIVLDDPLGNKDPALDPYLIKLIDDLRRRSTVIYSTHRPDLILKADKIAVLDRGALAHFGPVAAEPAADGGSDARSMEE